MFVLITEEKVVMVLRGGNKNGQNVDQNLTDRGPKLAAMLRLWMPHAASAQPAQTEPFVMFKTESASYGTDFNVHAYSDMIKRAWKTAGCNPQDDSRRNRPDFTPSIGKKSFYKAVCHVSLAGQFVPAHGDRCNSINSKGPRR